MLACAESGFVASKRKRKKKKLYLEIGNGVGDREPGSPGVLLVTKRAVESPGDGTEVEGADGRSSDAVSKKKEVVECGPPFEIPPSLWIKHPLLRPLKSPPFLIPLGQEVARMSLVPSAQ